MIYFLLLVIFYVCCESSLIQKYKIKDGYTSVPVTYHPYQSESVQVKEIQYFKIIQCDGGKGDNTQGQISLILPNNPIWSTSKGRILVEISKCVDKFDLSCVLYTNYVWNGGINPVYYSNITFDLSTSNDTETFYMRVTSKTFPADFSFEFSYVSNAPIFNGQYSYDAFGTSGVNGEYKPVSQYVKTSTVQTVNNFEIIYLFMQFCVANYANPQSNWIVNVDVASSTQKPKSAFEIWGCSFDDGTENCFPTYNDGEDLSAVGVVGFSMQNNQGVNLNDGFYIGIYGIGGEFDSTNEAILYATTSSN